MTIRLTRAAEGQMLTQMSLSAIWPGRAYALTRNHRDVFGRVTSRKFWPCEFGGVSYLADLITGTLYDATSGECCGTKQMAIVAEMPAKPKRLKGAREAAGWNNDSRRAAA